MNGKNVAAVVVVTGLIGGVACRGSPDPDPTAQACQAYVDARHVDDVDAAMKAIDWMEQLAANVDAPEDSNLPVLAPRIYADFLGFGPRPWAPVQYEILFEDCLRYLGSSPG